MNSASKTRLILATLAALGLAPLTAHAQNLVQNPSFEAPQVGASGFSTDVITDWSGTGSFGVQSYAAFDGPPYNLYSSTPPGAGAQYAFVNSGTIFQDVTTTVVAGDTYDLSAYVGDRSDHPNQTGAIDLYSLGGGTLLVTSGPVVSPSGTFTQYAVRYVATAADAAAGGFRVVLENPSSQPQINYDLVSLSVAAAPEPSQTAALGLGVLGLAGLAFKARRRRSA